MDSNPSREVVEAELVPTGLARADLPDTVRYDRGGELARPGVGGGWDRQEIRDKWLRAKKLRSGSQHTVAAYARDIDTFFEWCDSRGLDIFGVFGPHIEEWADELLNVDNVGRYKSKPKPRSPSTVARMMSSVSSFYNYAGRHTHGAVGNPVDYAERVQAVPEKETTSLERDQVDRVREAARSAGLKEYALVQLLLGTGLRVSEVCMADTSDLTQANGKCVILVRRKGGKRARVRVPPAAERALRRYIRDRKGPLFLLGNGERMTRRMVAWHVEQVVRVGLNIPPQEPCTITPHSLRRTAATLALTAGATVRDLQVQLGHSRSDTTMRYDRAIRDLENSAADMLAELVEDA